MSLLRKLLKLVNSKNSFKIKDFYLTKKVTTVLLR
uniref:Uncharacterized protein n=1 Tax=Siphoviridae sp. ctLAw30 TaxID=2826249 RepID=A0A8S5M0T0_9CAUD|nr:MAG TPA: hypothetical protein [Siphoviridae sp. ctLAw30]